MSLQKKSMRIGSIFLALLVVGGLVLIYRGNDAIALAVEQKSGILTAEQVKVAFDSVGGRMIRECVQEAQEVKAGDVLLELDCIDIDLSIEKLKAQIGQIEAQIASLQGSIAIGYAQADTNEEQSRRQIDQQREAVNAAAATYENKRVDYRRMEQLAADGAIAQSELDNARMGMEVARANSAQQRQLLANLLAGANDTGDSNQLLLPTIEQSRRMLQNQQNDVQNLLQQKKSLEVELATLRIQKKRLTLRAPEDGKILKILAKQGEMVAPNTPVILLESRRYYYDIYINEMQAAHLAQGDSVCGKLVAASRALQGRIRFITAAPGFADLKMSREKGQSDLAAFQVRIYTEAEQGVLPGMTVEVMQNEFIKR